jgi:hypothetical protein
MNEEEKIRLMKTELALLKREKVSSRDRHHFYQNTERKCRGCKKTMKLTQYYSFPKNKLQKSHVCRLCQKEKMREYQKKTGKKFLKNKCTMEMVDSDSDSE